MRSAIAIEFVRHVLNTNPNVHDFGDIYDAMSRTACSRTFHNLGHFELAQAGVSFSLLSLQNLEHLVRDVQKAMSSEN